MSRQIKFRGYDSQEKRMFTWDELCGRSNTVPEAHPITSLYSGAGWEIMQFTGVTARSGEEVYEGDVVHIYNHDADQHAEGIVEYEENKYIVSSKDFYSELHEEYVTGVLGNIYQNPDMKLKYYPITQ